MLKEYCYGNITPITEMWFILQIYEAGCFRNPKYIFVGRDELVNILVGGLNSFLKETQINQYTSKKAIARRYSKEPAYAHLFTSSKRFT